MENKRSNLINETLWYCAGVNKNLVRQCPTEYSKYAGMGGTILATAIMASLSGGYALFAVFKSDLAAICFGIFWGLVIFNLDRFIVSTMFSDGEVTISKREFIGALPRLIIALFLGIIISNPLELKIFEKEINYEIEQLKNEKANDNKLTTLRNELDVLKSERASFEKSKTNLRKSSTSDYNTAIGDRISEVDKEIDRVRKSISSYENQLSSVNRNIQKATANGGEIPQNLQSQRQGLLQNRNAANSKLNKIISDKRNLENEVRGDMNNELKNLGDRIANNDNSIKLKEQEIASYQIQIKAIADNYDGYMARMEAFSALREHKPGVNIVAWFVTLLFIIIEIAPTLFKLMIPSGPYDEMLKADKHRAKILSEKMISDINDEVNTSIRISTEKNRQKLEAEILSNEKLLRDIANAQTEIMSKAIEKWREQELLKAESNPNEYIKLSE